MNIGERIKVLRERRELTLEQVGAHLGVNKATVQRYESGNIDIKRNVAIRLAEILHSTPAYIMGWSDDPAPTISTTTLTCDEEELLRDYRLLSNQGKEFVRQTMVAALNTYKKDCSVSTVEASGEVV